MLEPGRYYAQVEKFRWVESQSKGTPGVELVFVVTRGDMAGQKLSETLWLTEKTMEKRTKDLYTCGWDGSEQLNGLGSVEVSITVENEIGQNGRSYPRVKWIDEANKVSQSSAFDLEPSKQKAVIAQLRGQLVAAGLVPAAPARPQAAPQRQPQPQAQAPRPPQITRPTISRGQQNYDATNGADDIPF